MPTVRVAGGDALHYLDIGRGPPCVLLHGFGMRAANFVPFVLPFAREHRFILLDLRGFGGSSRLPLRDPDLLLSHASDLHDALDALHLGRPALGGISMGAATSLAYLRRFGFDRFRAYLHIDQAPRILNDATYRDGLFGDDQETILGAWGALTHEIAAYGRDAPYARLPEEIRRALSCKLAQFFAYAFHGRILRAASALLRYEAFASRVLDLHNWPLYIDAIRAYRTLDYDFRPSLPRVSIPMHILVGVESRMYPPPGQLAMQKEVPHARVVRFESTGHAVMAEAPLRFLRALGEFLRVSLA
jgi:non-heme chloroperoxidase